nr:MAG TPA: hypothetical protein [Caudoviricetes sp.]
MKIVILDYQDGSIIIKDIPKELEDLDGDDILTNMGFSQNSTEYMITDGQLPISIETKGCTIYTTLK